MTKEPPDVVQITNFRRNYLLRYHSLPKGKCYTLAWCFSSWFGCSVQKQCFYVVKKRFFYYLNIFSVSCWVALFCELARKFGAWQGVGTSGLLRPGIAARAAAVLPWRLSLEEWPGHLSGHAGCAWERQALSCCLFVCNQTLKYSEICNILRNYRNWHGTKGAVGSSEHNRIDVCGSPGRGTGRVGDAWVADPREIIFAVQPWGLLFSFASFLGVGRRA